VSRHLGERKKGYQKRPLCMSLVDNSSLEVFKNYGFKPFCRLDWAIIKLLDKERSKDAEKTAQVMTKFV